MGTTQSRLYLKGESAGGVSIVWRVEVAMAADQPTCRRLPFIQVRAGIANCLLWEIRNTISINSNAIHEILVKKIQKKSE